MKRHCWRRMGAVLASAAGWTLAGCAVQPVPYTPRPAILPLDARTNDATRVHKWVRPVTVSLTGAGAAERRASVAKQLDLLWDITGHRFELVEGNEADVWLVFGEPTPQAALAGHPEVFAPLYGSEAAMVADLGDDPVATDGLCRSKWATSAEAPYEIVYAAGQVPSELPADRIEKCTLTLLVSALGGAEPDSPAAEEAEKVEDDPSSEATQAVFLLTVWYDYRVKPGVPVGEIKPIMAERLYRLSEALKSLPQQ